MIELLVIADDFTGALDTGVQFKAKNTLIRIRGDAQKNLLETSGREIQVLIIDAETRHMKPQDAYDTVFQIVSDAVEAGVPCIYKKTDSALRGNIGSELTAMLEASGQERLHFIPAFPRMGRKTVNGIHYIDGLPVAESVFGEDLFEPVPCSSVQDIIAIQSDVKTSLMGTAVPEQLPKGVLVYDAKTDEELLQIAVKLKEKNHLHLLVGCAGFAMVLPDLLGLVQDKSSIPRFCGRLLTVSGSINPITLHQLDSAERKGAGRIRLSPRQRLDPDWLDSAEGKEALSGWLVQIQSSSSFIIECTGSEEEEEAVWCAEKLHLELEEIRRRISSVMGRILERLLHMGLESTLLVTGGDTLMAFMRQIRQDEMIPICELFPGVVLSQIRYWGKTYNLISKSGGFGKETLLTDLEQMINHHSEEELVC